LELNERLAVDTNTVIEHIRRGTPLASAFRSDRTIFLPLPVLGELFAGAYASTRKADNVVAIELVIAKWTVVSPDRETAREYGRIRSLLREMPNATQARRNDLWIAALCIQHNLPLLTNDSGFDVIPGLTVVRS
jgi:tRNA(fMet)-specific endonuclease VapC